MKWQVHSLLFALVRFFSNFNQNQGKLRGTFNKEKRDFFKLTKRNKIYLKNIDIKKHNGEYFGGKSKNKFQNFQEIDYR